MIGAVVLLFLTIAIVLTFQIVISLKSTTIEELRRMANEGDVRSARVLHLHRSYGSWLLLSHWLFCLFLASLAVSLLNSMISGLIGVVVCSSYILTSYIITVWLGRNHNIKLASRLYGIINSYLKVSYIVIKPIAPFLNQQIKYYKDSGSKQMVEESGIKKILDSVAVGSVMTPIDSVMTIDPKEPLNPIAVNEMHKTGFDCFPVGTEEGDVVGILHIRDAIALRSDKLAEDVMRKPAYYINESANLLNAMMTFNKVSERFLIVTDTNAEIVGIVTLEDIISRLTGEALPNSNFDAFDDISEVAKVDKL